jgi:putative RNA 2'-phosphotransferase
VSDTEISKFLSYILRHNPAEVGIVLDHDGWTPFGPVCAAIVQKFGVSSADVLRVINENPKRRFTLDASRIRAAQGHSVPVELGHAPQTPPEVLYHGTTMAAWQRIELEGLQKMDRTHVHLSEDITTASIVAKRRKGPHVILNINTKAMIAAGHMFYLSDNAVWLCEAVAKEFIKLDT